MRRIKVLLFICLIVTLLIGCNKKEYKLAEDTWYVVDDSTILMLCETKESGEFKDLMVKLKGNGDSINETINVLENMSKDVVVNNALGVAYLRLRRFDEADQKFQEALAEADSAEDQACILSNLAQVMLYKENVKVAKTYVEDLLKLEVNDPLKNLVLQSNITAIELTYDTKDFVQKIAEIKKLINEEKRLLGSNQFVGIYNYEMLAYACYYDNNMVRCEYYINKARELNQKLYHYVDVDAHLYKVLALMYNDSTEGLDKSLECINKYIDIMGNWQTQDHYDLLTAYEIRGNIYSNLGWSKMDLAIKDYEFVLEQCLPYDDLAAVSFYNLAEAYNDLGDIDSAIESYARAYYIWSREDWSKLNQDMEKSLRNIYEQKVDKNDNYEGWFQDQINQAKDDLDKIWKE